MIISAFELEAATGASYRQIDYWCRVGIISPIDHPTPGTGQRRKFNSEIVDLVKFLAKFSRIVKDPNLFRKVYAAYDDGYIDLGNGFVLTWKVGE